MNNSKIIYNITFSRNKYIRKDGTRQVVITLYQHGKTTQVSTNIYVKEYQLEGGYVINHPLENEYNRYLFNKRVDIEKIELNLILKGKRVTPSIVRKMYESNIVVNPTVADFISSMNERTNARGEKTKESYVSLSRQIERFQKGVRLYDINSDWINDFISWLREKNLSHNTIVGRLKLIRCIINEAIRSSILNVDDDPFKTIKIPSMRNREEFLSIKEVMKIESLELVDKNEVKIRDAFLFACYTGFRFSDLNSLNNGNMCKIRGKEWIIKKPNKTENTSSVTVKIPIYRIFDGKPLRLIEKYGGIENLTHIGNNASCNKVLKKILADGNIAIGRKITFHTARHTAATLLLMQDVPITTVQKILGHTKIQTTQIYAKVTNDTIEKDIEKAFRNKKKK